MAHQGRRRERAGTAVEFAVILPVLASVLFGIIEFSNAYSQRLDIRHGAREAARLVAVNYDPLNEVPADQTATIVAAACARMDDNSGAEMRLTLETVGEDDVGDIAIVEARTTYDASTPFVNVSTTLDVAIDARLERSADWSPTEGWIPCRIPCNPA